MIITTPTGCLGPIMENLEAHLEFQKSLEEKGVTFGSGPFFADNEEDWQGEGMVIIRAGSLAEAKEIAAADPMHTSGARRFTVRPWLLNEGTITLKVRYSGSSRDLI